MSQEVSGNFSAYACAYNANDLVTSVDNNGTAGVPPVVLAGTYDNIGHRLSLAATVAGTADFLDTFTFEFPRP